MRTKKPAAVFEMVFVGGNVYPERIPIRKLTEALSAVSRLVAGRVAPEEDDDEEEDEESKTEESVSLLDVSRGSAVFRFVGPRPAMAIQRFKDTGKILLNPDLVDEEHEFVLRPVKDLSAIANSLDCSIILRQADNRHEQLARIERTSYTHIAGSLLVSGTTSISGIVQRVGGATAMRCALRVSFQSKLLYCKVQSDSVARALGDGLYQRVIVSGKAHWLKNSMRLYSFTIQDVSRTQSGSLSENLKALWNAGLNDWENASDPEKLLHEIRGE